MKLHRLLSLSLFVLSAPAWASTPSSGELTDTSGPIVYTAGPYLVPNPGGISSTIPRNCTPAITDCDQFALKVTIPDKFRKDEKNKKEIVQVVLTPSGPAAGSADLDLYLLDSAGGVVGSSTGSTAAETVSVPLSVLKDGNYTVEIIAGLPLGSSSSTDIHIGRGKAATKAFTINPMVVAPGASVSFDASRLNDSPPANGYQFDFGDGTTFNSADGTAMHTYAADGQYLAKVSYLDPAGARGLRGASQTVLVATDAASVTVVGDKSGSSFSGAFGLPALFSLFGLALLKRRSKL